MLTVSRIAILCYTNYMPSEQKKWHVWVDLLKRWGLSNFMASIIDNTGPVSIFLAQILLTISPFVSSREDTVQSFASMLEDPVESHAFASLLREEHVQ
jgi:hypothetical protein